MTSFRYKLLVTVLFVAVLAGTSLYFYYLTFHAFPFMKATSSPKTTSYEKQLTPQSTANTLTPDKRYVKEATTTYVIEGQITNKVLKGTMYELQLGDGMGEPIAPKVLANSFTTVVSKQLMQANAGKPLKGLTLQDVKDNQLVQLIVTVDLKKTQAQPVVSSIIMQ